MKSNKLKSIWIKAAIVGSTWAAIEIIVGSFLHNLQIPFTGTILTTIGVFLLISLKQLWPEKGLIIRAGIICAIMKSISPSAIIIGPMVGIFAEAFILEMFIAILGSNLLSYTIGGALAVFWSLIQKIIFFIVMYGSNFIDVIESIYKYLVKVSSIVSTTSTLLVIIVCSVYFLSGIIASIMGYLAGQKFVNNNKYHKSTNDIKLDNSKFYELNDKLKYNPYFIILILFWIIITLYVISVSNCLFSTIFGVSFVIFVTVRYKNAMLRLKKPIIWIQFILLTFISVMFWNWHKSDAVFNIEGLLIGIKMISRAIIVIFGFSALSVELRNPFIKTLFYKGGFSNIHSATTIAFSVLPTIIATLPEKNEIVKSRQSLIYLLLNQSQNLFNYFEQEQTK